MKIEKKIGLVRGVVEIYQDHGGFEPITVYTYWHRHDEPNLEEVILKATNDIIHAYSKDRYRFSTAVLGTEWREYKG